MSDTLKNAAISELVAALPEIYQPIYGHAEYNAVAARDCAERLRHIVGAYEQLAAQLGRPLKVLDLGSSQGFFSFQLAARGATVQGVDFLAANVAICRGLALEHPELAVTFEVGRIEEFLPRVQVGQYDLVLGLSVFHHLIHEMGTEPVERLLGSLAGKVYAGIFELALAQEPLYWGPAQPAEPSLILAQFPFVHELSQIGTHLSEITRPLYYASNTFWYLNGQMGKFGIWKTDSHALARDTHFGTRRYFYGEGVFIKLCRLNQGERDAINIQEHETAIHFLENPPAGFKAPKLILHGRNPHELWQVRESLPGELLLDFIQQGIPYDAHRVLRDLLRELTLLEQAGLYFTDLRTWNIIIYDHGTNARLIDYGAIGTEPKDCSAVSNLYVNFFIFVHELLARQIENPFQNRAANINPQQLPPPYCAWAQAFWAAPETAWSFQFLTELFAKMCPSGDADSAESTPRPRWVTAQLESHALNRQAATQRIRELEIHSTQQDQVLLAEQERAAQQEKIGQEKITALEGQVGHLDHVVKTGAARNTQLETEVAQLTALVKTGEEQNARLEQVAGTLAQQVKDQTDQNTQLQTQVTQLTSRLEAAETLVAEQKVELRNLYASFSVRVTAPLRKLKLIAKRIFGR